MVRFFHLISSVSIHLKRTGIQLYLNLLYTIIQEIGKSQAAWLPPPQRNPVPSHPLCPMSSVSAWSTAAAARSATARAIHESPVISAEIDDEVLDFSAVFPVDTEFLPFSGKGEGEKAVPSFDVPCPVLSFLMRNLEIYGAGFFKTAGLSCPSTI